MNGTTQEKRCAITRIDQSHLQGKCTLDIMGCEVCRVGGWMGGGQHDRRGSKATHNKVNIFKYIKFEI